MSHAITAIHRQNIRRGREQAQEIVDIYNQYRGGLPSMLKLTDKRFNLITQAIGECSSFAEARKRVREAVCIARAEPACIAQRYNLEQILTSNLWHKPSDASSRTEQPCKN